MASPSSATPRARTTAAGRKRLENEMLASLFRWRAGAYRRPGRPGSRIAVGSFIFTLQRVGVFERADADHRAAHAAGRHACCDYVRYSLSSHYGGAAFPPASLEYPGNAFQSSFDRIISLSDAGHHAAAGDGNVPKGMGTARSGTGDLATGLERWFATTADLLAPLCP